MDAISLINVCLLFSVTGSCLAEYCKTSYSCAHTCYTKEKSSKTCGFLWASRCTRYFTKSHSCYTTCYKQECCPGYAGHDCKTPTCYGSFYCLNGGNCTSPDRCVCKTGYGGDRCEKEMCDDASYCLNGGTCNSPNKCICLHGFRGERCEEEVPITTSYASTTTAIEVSEEMPDQDSSSNSVLITALSSSAAIVVVIAIASVVAICIFRKVHPRFQRNENLDNNIANVMANLQQGVTGVRMSVLLRAGLGENCPVQDNKRDVEHEYDYAALDN